MPNYIIENRALIEAIKGLSDKYNIQYDFFSSEWIIRLRRGHQTRFIFAYGFDCNSQASGAIACDKVATYQLLTDNQLSSVPHYLLKSAIDVEVDRLLLDELLRLYEDIVIKPLRGSRGEGITKCGNAADISNFIHDKDIETWAASPYIDIKRELRLVVFNGTIQLAYEKLEPKVINNVRMYNLNLGAHAKTLKIEDIDADTVVLAVNAMKAIGLQLGAVDIIFDSESHVQVLEINSGFSLEHYAVINVENRKKVVALYEHIISTLFYAL